MQDFANCDTICNVLLGDGVDDHAKSCIGNGNDSNHIVSP